MLAFKILLISSIYYQEWPIKQASGHVRIHVYMRTLTSRDMYIIAAGVLR